MAKAAFRKTAAQLPEHDHASDHRLLQALQQYKTKRRLELAKRRRPSAEIAAERIREFAWDLGAEKGWERWIAAAQRAMGAQGYTTIWRITTGRQNRVSPDVVDQIANFTGIPAGVFYDQDEVWNGNGRS